MDVMYIPIVFGADFGDCGQMVYEIDLETSSTAVGSEGRNVATRIDA
jgi:hypothetical protein